MAKIFISYSRKDIDFAKQLTAELQNSDLDFWIDWEGIPPTVDWWREIEKGIEEADVFIFLISPDSAKSKICGQEIDTAVKNGKRIIPIVVREIEWEDTPPQLGHLNYIFFSREDDFDTAVKKLLTAIHTDYEWAATHRRLQVKALDWERNNKENGYLLRGKDLQDAESDLATNTSKDPYPTDLQREYVFKSRKVTDRQGRIITGVSIVSVIALIALAVFGFLQAGLATNNAATAQANLVIAQTAQVNAQNNQILADNSAATAVANEQEAIRQATISRAGDLVADAQPLLSTSFQTALLLGIEAYQQYDTPRSRSFLMEATNSNNQIKQFLSGTQYNVSSVAFSPDGKILASGSSSGIAIWDMEAEQPTSLPIAEYENYEYAVNSITFNPVGTLLASGSEGGVIILWDIKTWQIIGQPLETTASEVNNGIPIHSVAFSPDSSILVSGNHDATISLWDMETKQLIDQPLMGHTDVVNSVAFSPDGKILASGSRDGTIILWDMDTRQPIGQPLTGNHGQVNSVAFHPDGTKLASGNSDGTVVIWDVDTGQALDEPLTGHTGSVTSIAFRPDGETLISGDDDGNIILWNIMFFLAVPTIGLPLTRDTDPVNSLAFSPDGSTLASSSQSPTIILWDGWWGAWHRDFLQLIGEKLYENIPDGNIKSVAFSPDGVILAEGNDQLTITLIDIATGQSNGEPLTGHIDAVNSLAFSPDGKILASGSGDGTIILWDMDTRQPIGQPLAKHVGGVNSVAFSPDGKILASGSDDSTIILWDMDTRQPIEQPLMVHIGTITCVAFSPNGKILASGSSDETIILWDVGTRKTIGDPLFARTTEASAPVSSLAFSPDGKILASSDYYDDRIILWNMETRQRIRIPLSGGLQDQINTLAFSPDGKTLASGGSDSTIVLWSMENRQPMGIPMTAESSVNSLAFSPDGKILASGSNRSFSPIILWNLNPAEWIDISCQRVGRNLTRDDWEIYFPNEEYRKTCDQWSLEPEAVPILLPTPEPSGNG